MATSSRGIRLLIPVLLLGAVAGGLWWYGQNKAEAQTRFRLAKVERGPLVAAVAASGTLNAVVTVQVGSQISGQVKELAADFNTPVKKNQVIARIDPATFELRVAQSRADLDAARSAVAVARANLAAQQAQLAQARVNLADAQRDFERKQSLVEKGFISAADLDKARTVFNAAREQARSLEAQTGVGAAQVDSALAQVKQREAALRQAEVDLDRTYIRAPVDGVVISRSIDAGQTVAASLQAPTLFTIAQDLRRMQVEAAIDEADVGRLALGQAASFTVDAFPNRNFSGEVKQIRKAALNVQNVVTYTVIVSADNPGLQLLPGMTANVRIITAQRDGVLKLPNAALRFRPANGEPKPAEGGAKAQNGAPPAAGGAAQLAQQFRERVFAELNLDAAQKTRAEELFADARQRFMALRDIADEAERRKASERLRADVRHRVADLLRPEQKSAYERILADLGGRASSGRAYVPEGADRTRAVELRLGLSDGSMTEIADGPLKEGDEVIIGVVETPKKASGGPRLF